MIYPLEEVLLLCLLAVLAGAESVVDIARFGTKKRELLRRFRPFTDGTPSHDQLGDIFATLDAEKFQQCFVAWVATLTGASADVIAIDGKTVRRSYQEKGRKAAIHMVSAFAARQRLVLGQVKVSEKSNEIVAIPRLLDMLSIDGAIVTIDAMGCQRGIAQKIIDKKADYVLALKGNQGTLREDVEGPNRKLTASGIRRSAGTRLLMAIASKPAPQPRCRLAPGTSRLAEPESHRHGRKHARKRGKNRVRDALLHHIPAAPGGTIGTIGTGRPQPLGGGKHALDHGLPG